MPIDLVEGWTGAVDMQLLADALPVNLSGMTVELVLRTAGLNLVATAGNVTVLSSTDGTVRYFPDANDLVAARGPYRARYRVTDGLGRIVFFPSAAADVWTVRQA